MILDDEDILIGNVKRDLKLGELTKVLGKLYITESGLSGFILSLDEKGLPSLIASIPTPYISFIDFVEKYCNNSAKWKGCWTIATKELLTKHISNWNVNRDDYSLLIENLVVNSTKEVTKYQKINRDYLYNIFGGYWLGEFDDDFMYSVRFQMVNRVFSICFEKTTALLTTTAASTFNGVLLLHELSDEEKISIQDSDKILDELLCNYNNNNPLI